MKGYAPRPAANPRADLPLYPAPAPPQTNTLPRPSLTLASTTPYTAPPPRRPIPYAYREPSTTVHGMVRRVQSTPTGTVVVVATGPSHPARRHHGVRRRNRQDRGHA